nr:hypothetical protein [Pseudomonas sp. Marseille-Q3773]
MMIQSNPGNTGSSFHVDPSTLKPSPPTQNPNTSDAFNVIVSIPDNIEIRMVDASALGDYEVWIFIASLVSNFVIGFFVAYVQEAKISSPTAPYIGWTTFGFFVLFAISVAMAIAKRMAMRKKGRKISLKTSGASEVR